MSCQAGVGLWRSATSTRRKASRAQTTSHWRRAAGKLCCYRQMSTMRRDEAARGRPWPSLAARDRLADSGNPRPACPVLLRHGRLVTPQARVSAQAHSRVAGGLAARRRLRCCALAVAGPRRQPARRRRLPSPPRRRCRHQKPPPPSPHGARTAPAHTGLYTYMVPRRRRYLPQPVLACPPTCQQPHPTVLAIASSAHASSFGASRFLRQPPPPQLPMPPPPPPGPTARPRPRSPRAPVATSGLVTTCAPNHLAQGNTDRQRQTSCSAWLTGPRLAVAVQKGPMPPAPEFVSSRLPPSLCHT